MHDRLEWTSSTGTLVSGVNNDRIADRRLAGSDKRGSRHKLPADISSSICIQSGSTRFHDVQESVESHVLTLPLSSLYLAPVNRSGFRFVGVVVESRSPFVLLLFFLFFFLSFPLYRYFLYSLFCSSLLGTLRDFRSLPPVSDARPSRDTGVDFVYAHGHGKFARGKSPVNLFLSLSLLI